MTVLIWKVNQKGKIIAQCDGRCYNSRFPYKYCICQGKNHAVGLTAARGNVRELFRSGTFPASFRFPPFVQQQVLDFSPSPRPGKLG